MDFCRLNASYLSRQEPKFSCKCIEPRWQIPAQRAPYAWRQTRTLGLLDSSSSPGSWFNQISETARSWSTPTQIHLLRYALMATTDSQRKKGKESERCHFTHWGTSHYRGVTSLWHNTVFREVIFFSVTLKHARSSCRSHLPGAAFVFLPTSVRSLEFLKKIFEPCKSFSAQ